MQYFISSKKYFRQCPLFIKVVKVNVYIHTLIQLEVIVNYVSLPASWKEEKEDSFNLTETTAMKFCNSRLWCKSYMFSLRKQKNIFHNLPMKCNLNIVLHIFQHGNVYIITIASKLWLAGLAANEVKWVYLCCNRWHKCLCV